MTSRYRWFALLAALVSGAAACNGNDPVSPPYNPLLPSDWASAVTNSYFPLMPGTVWQYQGETEEGTETTTVEVLLDTRMVNGVTATIVHDRVYLDGDLIEDTYDWYAQDADGNVWYLGEDSKEVANGEVVGTEGSWEWGKDDALPGIIMWANPAAHSGEEYRQEYYAGEAEDWGKVVATGETVIVPAGTFDDCIKTEDWNGLEGRIETLEYKFYCPSIGTALELPVDAPEEKVELVNVTPG